MDTETRFSIGGRQGSGERLLGEGSGFASQLSSALRAVPTIRMAAWGHARSPEKQGLQAGVRKDGDF